MREKLNSNPIYQAAALGVLGIAMAFFLLTRMGGGGDPAVESASVPEAPTTGTVSPSSPAPGATADPAAPVTPAPPAPSAPPPDAVGVPGANDQGAFKASPGLPAPIANAYQAGDQVVLLITNSGSIDDKRIQNAAEKLRSRDNVSLTVIGADEVPAYSRITRGVSLNRTPAMIVIEPKARAGTGLPEATVSYGYRGKGSVRQALADIVYNGRDVGYDPN